MTLDLSCFAAVKEASVAAEGTGILSTIVSVLLDEARLMVALGGCRLTERAIDREAGEAEERFATMVREFYLTPHTLTADDILDRRAIAHVAWALAEKLRAKFPNLKTKKDA